MHRSDFLYGTYRARMKTSNVEGTVAAFYFYRNDTCEIDIESLSKNKDPSKTYFAVQPQIYEPDGTASALTNEKHDLEFDPTNVTCPIFLSKLYFFINVIYLGLPRI